MAGDKKEPNRGDLRLLAPLSACATQSELPSRELPWPMPVLLAYRRQSGSPTPLSRKPPFFNSLLGARRVWCFPLGKFFPGSFPGGARLRSNEQEVQKSQQQNQQRFPCASKPKENESPGMFARIQPRSQNRQAHSQHDYCD